MLLHFKHALFMLSIIGPVAAGPALVRADDLVAATCFGLPPNNVRTSEVGWRESTKSFHYGIDFSSRDARGRIAPLEFTAGVSGTVVVHEDSRWNTISVRLENGNVIQYLHASRIQVTTGDKVTPSSILGRTGDAGSPGSIHLHVQARDRSGKYIDPDRALLGQANRPVRPDR